MRHFAVAYRDDTGKLFSTAYEAEPFRAVAVPPMYTVGRVPEGTAIHPLEWYDGCLPNHLEIARQMGGNLVLVVAVP